MAHLQIPRTRLALPNTRPINLPDPELLIENILVLEKAWVGDLSKFCSLSSEDVATLIMVCKIL